MTRITYFLVFVLLLGTTSIALASGDDGGADLAYAVSATAQFGVVTPETGDFHLVGITTSVLSGLALGPKQVIYSLDAANNLVNVNPATATTTVIGNTGLPVSANGNVTLITFLGKGLLFAVDPNNDLYSLNLATGLATKIGATGIPVPDFVNCVTGNSLAGANGHLYFTWQVDDMTGLCQSITPSTLYRINPYTGAAGSVGATGAAAPIVGAGFIDDTLYGFTFGLPVNLPNQILALDLVTGNATLVHNQAANLDSVFGAIRTPRGASSPCANQ